MDTFLQVFFGVFLLDEDAMKMITITFFCIMIPAWFQFCLRELNTINVIFDLLVAINLYVNLDFVLKSLKVTMPPDEHRYHPVHTDKVKVSRLTT